MYVYRFLLVKRHSCRANVGGSLGRSIVGVVVGRWVDDSVCGLLDLWVDWWAVKSFGGLVSTAFVLLVSLRCTARHAGNIESLLRLNE